MRKVTNLIMQWGHTSSVPVSAACLKPFCLVLATSLLCQKLHFVVLSQLVLQPKLVVSCNAPIGNPVLPNSLCSRPSPPLPHLPASESGCNECETPQLAAGCPV